MSLLLEIPLNDGEEGILVEVEQQDIEGGLVLASAEPGKPAAKAVKSLSESLETIVPLVQAITTRLRPAGPDEFEVQFGLKFGGETGLIVAKGTAEVNLSVKMKWQRNSE